MKKRNFEMHGVFLVLLVLVGIAVGAAVETKNTAGEILDFETQKLNAQFYKEIAEGNYVTETYRWTLSGENSPIDQIPCGTKMNVPDYPVLFDQRFPTDLRAVVVRVAERTDKAWPLNIKVAAVYVGDCESLVPGYDLDTTNFKISFYDYQHNKRLLEYCSVEGTEKDKTTSGADYTVYYIECKVMWENN